MNKNNKIILILFFINIFFIFENNFYLNNKIFKLVSKSKEENHENINNFTYKDFPNIYDKKNKISVLIPHYDKILIDKNYSNINMIKTFLNQSLKDIEILISLKKNTTLFSQINEYNKQYNNLKLFEEENDIFNDTINLVLSSQAKYVTIIKKYVCLNNTYFFETIFNETFGKINNIYEYKIENEVNYLIKNKILKDIIDDNIIFNDINKLENYIKIIQPVNLNYIPISYSIDNKYTIYSYVSMISILESKNYNIIYNTFFAKKMKYKKI